MVKLEDVFVRPEEANNHVSPEWDKEDVRKAVLYALWDLTTNSYYAPYLDRFPVVFQDEFSTRVIDNLDNAESYACTEGQRVYFDTERAAKFFNEVMKKYGRTSDIGSFAAITLAHEYTHIICEHCAIGQALRRKYKGRVPKGVITCHMIACEIQANRGAGIVKHSPLYQALVTEEQFPCTKGLYTYNEIFAALLREYNKEREKMNKFAKMIKDALDDDMSEGNQQKQGGGKGNKSGQQSEDDGNDRQSIINKLQEKKEKDAENDGELTEEEIKQAILEAEEAAQEVYTELQELGGGFGLDKVDGEKLELNPNIKQTTEFKRWDEDRIKNEIKRMRGYIAGSFAREREKSYSRPSRRSIDPNSTLIRKGIKNGKRSMPRVLVAMDSSGSMGGTPVTVVATAIGNLFKDLGRPTEGCYIIKHESRCSSPQPLSNWQEVVKSFYPSGGNCFNNVVKLANELNVDVVFNIGDGCDCCLRRWSDEADTECEKFKAAGRKWVDTLILDKTSNGYFDSEYNFDKQHGFTREILQLGSKIEEYL